MKAAARLCEEYQQEQLPDKACPHDDENDDVGIEADIDNSLNKAGNEDLPAGPAKPGDPASREECNRENNAFRQPDCVEVASMDSFPCSDAPGYYPIRL